MSSLTERIRHGWNAFINNKDPTTYPNSVWTGGGSYYRPDKPVIRHGNERSIVTAIYNRIAIDVAAVDIRHVKLDENHRFSEYIEDGLDNIFTLEANIDQDSRDFVQDIAMSMFDEGCVALVPVETDSDPEKGSFEILSMRTGKVIEWYPQDVRLDLYNDRTGKHEELVVPKNMVAIIPNPFYAVMNAPNSTLQRLIRKLNYLDAIDEQSSSGKLDLIVQLPYTVKTDLRRNQAEERRKSIEMQLTGSKYGIAYIDATEKVTQLNRSVENNLMSQIEFLTTTLYGQLGITDDVMNNTASEETMVNYYNRTIEPILTAICKGCNRTFISKTARTQGQSMMFFRDPFRLASTNKIAEMADKFTRNEIMSSNEFRAILGMKPSDDPEADELRNKNLNRAAMGNQNGMSYGGEAMQMSEEDQIVEDLLSSLEASIDEILGENGLTVSDSGKEDEEAESNA